MAKKPFPFSVCEQCCGTGGGGGSSADLSDYVTKDELYNNVVVLSNTMSKDEIVTAINTAPKGTMFDIQTNLNLYDVNVSFPEESIIYSSVNNVRKTINFGYENSLGTFVDYELNFGNGCKISDLNINISSDGTFNVVGNFGKNCIVTNCTFNSYGWGSFGSNTLFMHCLFSIAYFHFGERNTYVKCIFTSIMSDVMLDFSDTYLSDCKSDYIKADDAHSLETLTKVKALNPDMNIVDAEGNKINGLYATCEDVGNIETAIDNIIAIQNSLIGGDSE